MSLFTLPTELRHEIYSYLCPHEPFDIPTGRRIITRSSHTPPPIAIQLVCRFLNYDVKAFFYSVTTIRISTCSPFNFTAQELPVIRQARKVEFEIEWWGISQRLIPPTLEKWKQDRQRDKDFDLEALRGLNVEAKCLQKLVVSIVTVRCDEEDFDQNLMLERLEKLMEVKSEVMFVAGEIRHENCEYLAEQTILEEYVKWLNAKRA